MENIAVRIDHLSKEYRLGTIGRETLSAELQSKWAKIRKKEDPNSRIGEDEGTIGKKFWALDDINLEIHKGEAVGIIGHNGAGKSTLLKILSRVTAPTKGNAELHGRVASMLEVGTGFHPELTGRENIYMNGAILGMSKKEVDEKIEDIIEFSECRQFIDTPVKRYSSGMYVKLAFAVAAHLDAEIMIMDEVLAVGDIKFQQKCLGKMDDAAQGEGKTVLYVSHNMSTIRQLCTRCIVLDHGKIVFDGEVEKAIDIYSDIGRGELLPQYDLSDAKRPSLEHGKHTRILEWKLNDGRKTADFFNNERLSFDMCIKTDMNEERIGMYIAICHESSIPVGIYQTNSMGRLDAGTCKWFRMSLDLDRLAPGVYYFELDVFRMNSLGNATSVDHPKKKIFFEIHDAGDNKYIQWQRKYYGSARLGEIVIE